MNNLFKKSLSVILSVILTVSAFSIPGTVFASSAEKNNSSQSTYVEGEAIAVFENSTGNMLFSQKNTESVFGKGIKLKKTYTFGDTASGIRKYSADNDSSELKIAAFSSESLSTKQLIAKLEKNRNIKFAIPNFRKKITSVTKDAYSDYQWALENKGQNAGDAGKDVKAQDLWSKAEASDEEPVVAILDTGIDYNSDELKDAVWENPYGAKLVGKYGYDFTGTNKDGSPLDDNGHGTHVAGIIAAQGDNEKGISGINKNGVKIMALKWLDSDGYGETDDVIAAYEYVSRAMSLGTNVVAVNNSWGGEGTKEEIDLFDMIFDEVGEKGAVSFIAAGNDGMDFSEPVQSDLVDILGEPMGELYNVPAACESDYAITVAATNEKDELADFSSYSKKYVDVSAPGADILSTVPYNCFNPSIYTPQQRSALCSSYQSFDEPLSDGEFGNAVAVPNYSFEGEDVVTSSSIYTSDDYFGLNGRSLAFQTNDVIDSDNEMGKIYIYSIPFTIDNADQYYSYSFMLKANNGAAVSVFDIPRSVDLTNLDKYPMEDIQMMFGEKDNYWEHIYYDKNTPIEDEFSEYEKSTERQLVFVVFSFKKDTVVTIDDLAISRQTAKSGDFGNYDFYNGTSMATPYAVGAYALLSKAYPDASTIDLINMLKNTGRISSALEGKTQNNRVLSLEAPENTPPMLTSFAYNSKGNIAVKGSFKEIKSVKVDSNEVTPLSISADEIIIPDNKYNTNKITVEVSNDFGSDTLSSLVSNKAAYTAAKDVVVVPMLFDESTFAIPAGDIAYFFNSEGTVCSVYYDELEEGYIYDDLGASVDITKIFDDAFEDPEFTAATYMGGKIYFVAELPIVASNDCIIGYDKAFCSIDIETEKTTKLCELPNDMLQGFTLAGYNGAVYLMGGYDNSTSGYSKNIYKYNSSAKGFTKCSASLPEGTAFGKTIQYKNNLIYAYGANEAGTMPGIFKFDGKVWTKSKLALDSEDYEEYALQDNATAKVYDGNVGLADTGVFCSGAYVYGSGDTFVYNVENDTITSSKYSVYNTVGDAKIIGTTLPDCFIGFSAQNDFSASDLLMGGGTAAYKIPVKTGFATIGPDYAVDHCMIDTGMNFNCVYGDIVNVTVYPDNGYIVTGILANKVKYTPSKNKANIIIKDANTVVSATLKKVAPNQVTSLKVASTTSTGYTLSWSKPSRAAGYQVQQYKNKQWKTIATIKSADKTTYKVSKQTAGSNKYRVRAYSVYHSKTYYGAYSKTLTVYVPSKQTVKSLTAGKKSFTVKYSKNTNASGYQIQYATNSKFKSAVTKTVKNNKTTSYKASKLSAKKKYYVRVRSYKVVNGKNVYGAWSTAKTVITK